MRRQVLIGIALTCLASGAHGQTSYVGKKMSVASSDSSGVTVPAFPATVTIVSVAVPQKYKSKKNILAISTSVEEFCTGDEVYSVLSVGGVYAEPDPTGNFYKECEDNGGFEMVGREWFLVPESAGGPAIAPGALIELTLSSDNGTSAAALAVIQAELSK